MKIFHKHLNSARLNRLFIHKMCHERKVKEWISTLNNVALNLKADITKIRIIQKHMKKIANENSRNGNLRIAVTSELLVQSILHHKKQTLKLAQVKLVISRLGDELFAVKLSGCFKKSPDITQCMVELLKSPEIASKLQTTNAELLMAGITDDDPQTVQHVDDNFFNEAREEAQPFILKLWCTKNA